MSDPVNVYDTALKVAEIMNGDKQALYDAIQTVRAKSQKQNLLFIFHSLNSFVEALFDKDEEIHRLRNEIEEATFF